MPIPAWIVQIKMNEPLLGNEYVCDVAPPSAVATGLPLTKAEAAVAPDVMLVGSPWTPRLTTCSMVLGSAHPACGGPCTGFAGVSGPDATSHSLAPKNPNPALPPAGVVTVWASWVVSEPSKLTESPLRMGRVWGRNSSRSTSSTVTPTCTFQVRVPLRFCVKVGT